MLDIKRIRENPEEVIELLARKGKDAKAEIGRILELDQARRELAETGGPVFDPYAPSPAGPGRPRKAAADRDTDALIRTLCESLIELLLRTEQVQK